MRSMRLAALAVAALTISACAASDDMSTDAAGTGGVAATGVAGAGGGTAGTGGANSGTSGTGIAGAAGNGGTAGASGTTGSAGAGGASGSAGVAGSGGGGGRGGTGGVAGSGQGGSAAGRGGAGGSAGATGVAGAGGAGRGGATGAGGQGGSAGAGQAGAAGRGGQGGSAGVAGTTGSGGTAGQGNLPAGVTSLFPAPNGQNLCPDPPLKITFSGAPTLGSSGRIRVFNSGGTAVATVDMAAPTVSWTIGGMAFTVSRPVYIDGNTVSVTLPPRALAYGMTYYVNVESGAITAPGGAFSITDTSSWRFTTMAAAPSDRSTLSVALNGAGSFCSVQGAFDLIPANNTAAVTVTVGTGSYHEIVYLSRKSTITVQGQDRNGTVISATNNNNLNPSTRGRALFGVDNVSNMVFRNLTIRNLTPQGGSQAEALRLGSCDRCVVRDATIISLQDTLLWDGRVYANNCLIQGNVDFIWGGGAAYFVNSEIKTIGRAGYIVQARNPASTYGYVFVDSKITADSGVTNNVLARIDAGVYPASHVAYINCQMSSAISSAGWLVTGSATSSLRFWEYKSVDASGNAINVGQRLAGSRQLSDSEAAMMRDPTVVLAGWTPPAN